MTSVRVVTDEIPSSLDYVVPTTVDEQPEGPTAEQVAAVDGSLAARVAAKAQKLGHRTKRIPVPPDDVWGGELILVAKPAKLTTNMPYVKLIVDATDHLELLDDRTGQYDRVDGWAELGRIMGLDVKAISIGQIVTAVCDGSQEVVKGFAEQVLAFIMGRQSLIEQAMGEQ